MLLLEEQDRTITRSYMQVPMNLIRYIYLADYSMRVSDDGGKTFGTMKKSLNMVMITHLHLEKTIQTTYWLEQMVDFTKALIWKKTGAL
jgi:hypothetical protein